MATQHVPFAKSDNTSKCPVCGHPVRIIFRDFMFSNKQHADHYEPLMMRRGWRGKELLPVDAKTARKLKKKRKGKKTVAIVGLSPTSCSLAPYEDENVEIWALNEMHDFPFLKRWDRWFQIHDSKSWEREYAKRDVVGHLDWLKIDHEKPIVMQYWHPGIPNSEAYPLREVCNELLGDFTRGDGKVKYFTSSLAYMMAYALWQKPKIDRIEIYGFEMSDTIEYLQQKAGAEFWIGVALGRGVEVYTPPNCFMLFSSLYGGNEQGAGW